MKIKVEKKPKSTLEINIIVPNADVKKVYAEVLKETATKTDLPGFRKGQAPKNLVEEKTNPSELYGEVVNKLLETYYVQALKEHKITPISNPKVEIKELDLEKDFEFTATVALKPEIKLKEFRKDLKKSFEAKIKENKDTNANIQLVPNDVIKILIEKTKFDVADVLVEEEVARMITRLVDQIAGMGMKMEDYLKAIGKTTEELNEEYKTSAVEGIKAELIMQHLIEREKITVSDDEVKAMIAAMGDPKVQEQMKDPMQQWYIKSILTKNKLLSSLIEEAQEGVEIPKKKESEEKSKDKEVEKEEAKPEEKKETK